MKSNSKAFKTILGLTMLFGCFGATVFLNSNVDSTQVYAASEEHNHNGWTPITSFPSSPGNYYLTDDIVVPYNSNVKYAWYVPSGTTNLCLNGHIIRLEYDSGWHGTSAFYIGDGSTLKIHDCNETPHYYYFNRNTDWAYCAGGSSGITLDQITPNTPDGTVICIPGGAIVDASNFNSQYGGCVLVNGNNAHFYLNGGNIVGNYCTYGGGAVAVINSATFEMNGGRIVGNCGYEAGAIFASDYTQITINDGLIGHNVAHTTYGGGIASFGTVTMTGGTITSNQTLNYTEASKNRDGGGVFINKNKSSSSFTMTGGTISSNYSGSNGGGVCVNAGCTFNMSGGTIQSNCANFYGGGIENYGTFTMTGGSIINNYVINNGGGGIDNNGTVTITDSAIKGNSCKDGIGYQIRSPKGWGYASLNGYCDADNARNSNANYDLYYVTTNTKTKILFNKQGGKGGWDYNNPQPLGQMNTSSTLVPTRNGCTFLGYFDAPSGGTQYYKQDGNPVKTWEKIIPEITLYAHWDPATYLITFDKQGGTGGSDSSYISNLDSSTANNDQITIPQITGYTFLGYFDQPSGQGNQVYNASGEFIKGNKSTYANKTLYADWTASSYEVMLDNQNATTSGTTSVSATFDAEMPKITLPAKAYFVFKGYYTSENGEGNQYYNADGTSTRNWDINSNTTLYAYWIKTLNNFAEEFLALTNGYCDGDKSFIDTLKASFKLLSPEDVEAFIDAPIIVGKGQTYEAEGYNSKVIEAKSRYYNMISDPTFGIDPFLDGVNIQNDRGINANLINLFEIAEEDTPQMITFTLLSIAGGLSIGAYFFFKKKKYN